MNYYKISGEPIINKVYFSGNLKIHIVGVLVVIIWGIGNSLLTSLLSKKSDQDIHFSIKGTEINLIPYYQTGSKESGPKTYFKL